jgi:hypothetical protein
MKSEVETYLADAKAQGDQICQNHLGGAWKIANVLLIEMS